MTIRRLMTNGGRTIWASCRTVEVQDAKLARSSPRKARGNRSHLRDVLGPGGVPMSRRLIALLILTFAILTACGRANATHPAAAGYLIFLEGGFSNSGETVKVLDSGTRPV